MKNLLFLSGTIFLLSLGSCMLTPGDYNTAIMNQVSDVESEAANITRVIREQKSDEIQPALERGRERTKKALERLEEISSFRGDDSLRMAAVEFTAFYNRLFTEEYQEMLNRLQKGELTMEESDRLSEILIYISMREIEIKENLIHEHFAFIEKYGLIVTGKP